MPKKTTTSKKQAKPKDETVIETPKREVSFNTSVYLTKPLGLLGWDNLEPVLLAALATKEPLLLIGKHGTAKSFLLERLAQALDLNYRFYNASLVNYDDLVGIPVPDATQTSLRYISTPTAIWDAEVVFIDELNRTRPDLQNKLFSIIHERRVQGVQLEKLQYRWAAMNPAPTDDQDQSEVYLGAEPLDPALADRFGFLIEVPDWSDLSAAEKKVLLFDQFRGRHEFPVNVADLVARTSAAFEVFCTNPPDFTGYFVALESQLRGAGTRFSSRRLSTLFRTALGIHASRITLARTAGEETPTPDLDSSLFLALAHGHPGLASGSIDRGSLLAIHRQAWSIAGLHDDDPWKELLNIPDPVERVIRAAQADFPLSESELSSLVLEAVASQPNDEKRSALSLVLYLRLRTGGKIVATAAETLASQISRVLQPSVTTHHVYGKALTQCREVANICSGLKNSERDTYTRNLLNAFLPDGFKDISPSELKSWFQRLWKRFCLPSERSS
jgi:MoxR-like ATPase